MFLKFCCLNAKMDTLPAKFRSPPPKPPRRRHSDQLSVSSSGTFPSSRRKIADESHCNDNKHCTENSISSCGSLPASWTPEFCLENKIENLPVFAEKECTSESTNSTSCDKFDLKELILERSKNNFMHNIIPQLKSNSKQFVIKKCEAPYFYLVSKEQLSFDDLKKHFHKFLHKDSHRRHNSDPLPLNFDYQNFHPFSSAILDNNYQYDLCGTKENQCLLQEIKSLKEINCKLWENLCCVQSSIENLKNCSPESSNVLPISDLLMSIYDSLKNKDSAMEDRMRIILQERDKAINDLDRMVHAVANSFDDKYSCSEDKPSDEEIKELLKEVEVTCNPGKLLQQQRLLLSYLYRSKELKLDRMLHEMKLIAAERDSLKLKVQLLETELKHLKLSNEIWDTDNKLWESSLLNTLCQVIQQRDVVSKSYAHSLDYINSKSSVHEKSLDSEEINDCLQRLEGSCVKKKIFSFSPNEMKKYSPLSAKSRSDEVRYLKEEVLILNSSLEAEIDKRKCTEEKCVRLERLVNVLQKKLNGQNVGIPV
ncbi:mirror-image polydactyly gene 1 protein isoform X1 [Parasteatoda tepidariorum]|uniref:mirror-image polydactyly gene 1 protein isoform X1 n=1 Tax=Parasteatoda tepidariorum TaxID=114398 RepID=UPI0039BC3E74